MVGRRGIDSKQGKYTVTEYLRASTHEKAELRPSSVRRTTQAQNREKHGILFANVGTLWGLGVGGWEEEGGGEGV